MCLGLCVRSACAFVCTFTCVPCSLCAHVFTCKSPVLSINAPVRGLRCSLVPRSDNALAPAHSMRQSVVNSEHQALCVHTRTHMPACVRVYMQAGACMYVAACACACHHEESETSRYSIMCLYAVESMTHAYDSVLSACACAAMLTAACLRLRSRRSTLSRSRR